MWRLWSTIGQIVRMVIFKDSFVISSLGDCAASAWWCRSSPAAPAGFASASSCRIKLELQLESNDQSGECTMQSPMLCFSKKHTFNLVIWNTLSKFCCFWFEIWDSIMSSGFPFCNVMRIYWDWWQECVIKILLLSLILIIKCTLIITTLRTRFIVSYVHSRNN